MILGERASKLFRNTPYVSKHLRWGGCSLTSTNIQESAPPPRPARSAPRVHSAQRHPTVPLIYASSQSHSFPNSKCSKTAELCLLTPFFPNFPRQLPYLQLHLQAWTSGVSRFMLGYIWQQLSKLSCICSTVVVGQSVIQPQEPCRTSVQIQAYS